MEVGVWAGTLLVMVLTVVMVMIVVMVVIVVIVLMILMVMMVAIVVIVMMALTAMVVLILTRMTEKAPALEKIPKGFDSSSKELRMYCSVRQYLIVVIIAWQGTTYNKKELNIAQLTSLSNVFANSK